MYKGGAARFALAQFMLALVHAHSGNRKQSLHEYHFGVRIDRRSDHQRAALRFELLFAGHGAVRLRRDQASKRDAPDSTLAIRWMQLLRGKAGESRSVKLSKCRLQESAKTVYRSRFQAVSS